jgi:hypothetical protein
VQAILGGAPYRRLIRVCGVFAVGAGLAAPLGWGLGLPFLASLEEGRIAMAPRWIASFSAIAELKADELVAGG